MIEKLWKTATNKIISVIPSLDEVKFPEKKIKK